MNKKNNRVIILLSRYFRFKRVTYFIFISLFFIVAIVPSIFAATSTDTFSGETPGTLLENHTSDSGHTWTKNTVTPSPALVTTDSDRIRSSATSGDSIYMNSWTPSSADYDVSTDIYVASNTYTQQGVGGRASSTAFTGYYALFTNTNGGTLQLWRAGGGVIGSYKPPSNLMAGQTYNLKLSMRGNNIKVYWDSAEVISVTPTGADIVSSAGKASIYSKGPLTDTTGLHFDNFLATDGDGEFPLSAGTLSSGSRSSSTATLSWTASSGGTAPTTTQLQRSPQGANSWANVSGATTSPATDTGLTPATSYDYRVVYTDATPGTVYSNVVTVTTTTDAPCIGTSYNCSIKSDPNILYYWPMNEGSGASTLSPDVGGVNINLTGASTGAPGKIDGTATSFSGTSSFGVSASDLDYTGKNKVVVEALLKLDADATGDRMTWESSANVNNSSTGFTYITNRDGDSNVLMKGNNGYNYALFGNPTPDQWHHVVAVYDKGAAGSEETQLYVDGVLQSASSRPQSGNNSNDFGSNPLYIMSRAGQINFAKGSMQHLAVYSDLSPATIADHAQVALSGSESGFSAGTLSSGSRSSSTATLSWTASSGGTAPTTTQLQRSPQGANSWANVSGATTSPATDTGLTPATSYDYRVVYTDATPGTVYSNVVTVTTESGPTETYTVQAADLWDNGYSNVGTPRQSTFSRLIFTTDAASIVVNGTTDIYGSYPTYAHLGVRVNGVNQPTLAFTANGSKAFTVNLGAAGQARTVEIITGLQSRPSSIVGSYIDSVTYPDSASFNISPPTIGERVLVYGDSISVGGNATDPEYNSYVSLLRNNYDFRVMEEGWGYRSLHEDTNTPALRSAFVSRMSSYQPKTIYMAIGTNDYGLNRWNASSFGAAYAATLDELHAALPDTRIICQTPLVRGNEGPNGQGSNLSSYRAQIASICNARSSYATLIDGSTFLTVSDLADGVHPTTAGFAKYAKRIAPVLGSPGFTADGPASGSINEASGSFDVDISKANFLGDQSVTVAAPDGVINATAAGGSISGNGTGEITVTPANGATSFNFTYTPASGGAKQLVFSNAQNWKNPSSLSYEVEAIAPSVPTNLAATRANTQVALAWTAPLSSGSTAITDYTIQYKESSSSTWQTFTDGTSTNTNATVTGLTNGTQYDFRVRAVNSVGESPNSSTASAKPATTPSAPSLSATPEATGMKLTWIAPNTGGEAITDYNVQFKKTSASTWSTFNDGTSTNTNATVTGLEPGTSYDFQVAAKNSLGTGSFSSPQTATTLANAIQLSNPENSQPVILTTPVNTNLTCHATVRESSLAKQDSQFSYPLGLVDFCFDTSDSDNQVDLLFVTNLKPSDVVARKYDPTTKQFASIPDATITETTVNGQHALRLTYIIADNGPLDQDPTTGQIKDPVGLALVEQASQAPSSSNVATQSKPNSLVNTGTNTITPSIIATGTIVLGVSAYLVNKKRTRSKS